MMFVEKTVRGDMRVQGGLVSPRPFDCDMTRVKISTSIEQHIHTHWEKTPIQKNTGLLIVQKKFTE